MFWILLCLYLRRKLLILHLYTCCWLDGSYLWIYIYIYIYTYTHTHTRWFNYDRDKLWLVYTQISPGHIWTTLYTYMNKYHLANKNFVLACFNSECKLQLTCTCVCVCVYILSFPLPSVVIAGTLCSPFLFPIIQCGLYGENSTADFINTLAGMCLISGYI
jgi:hypothetical protein